MDKNSVLELIEDAKKELDNSLENAQLINDEFAPQYPSIPESPKECPFGKWFYDEGQKLKAFSNNPMECLQNIELLHEEFHRIYAQIFQLYQEHQQKGGLRNIFSKKKELPKEELEKLLRPIEHSHKKLMQELVKMYRRIQATPQSKFDLL